MSRIIPGLPEVKARAAAEIEKAMIGKPESERANITRQVTRKTTSATAANVTKIQEVGGLVGRFLLAILAVKIVSRQKLVRIFQIPGLGNLMVESLNNQDRPVVMGMTYILAIAYCGLLLLSDILYTLVNPQVSLK